eukprot:TRINITY_DN24955_c0_g1_i1.p1 TRINITY_DN24955_c0_g1~~TRINITY_DN24955_c0_g1_i1.p1  ORF type:complete len:208 (-),score=28.09 TRINITY_DN24955_c0_g1_i1:289-912(-)
MESLSFSLLLCPALQLQPSRALPCSRQVHERCMTIRSLSRRSIKLSTAFCKATDESSLIIGPGENLAKIEEKGGEIGEENDIELVIENCGNNSRRIVASIAIEAPLDAVWNVLTDYEKLADFIPGLLVSELMEKRECGARLLQIGQQILPLGLKFKAKGILDVFENDLEALSNGIRRDIDFKMVEGDFIVFEGKWRIEEIFDRQSMR